jgi:hypothetical protein
MQAKKDGEEIKYNVNCTKTSQFQRTVVKAYAFLCTPENKQNIKAT